LRSFPPTPAQVWVVFSSNPGWMKGLVIVQTATGVVCVVQKLCNIRIKTILIFIYKKL
jgi:hypothetical protein